MIKLMDKLKVIPAILGFRKSRKSAIGQGMVEFALALPILLLVTYGLIETGRLIFIYSSTLTAARQAARFGAASGNSDAGVPYYRDCNGIRSTVNRAGFINIYNDINITYDGGLDADGDFITIPGIDPSPTADTCDTVTDSDLGQGDRIKVQVSAQWEPIIAIIPSWQGFTITSSAERTLLMDVALGVDPVGQSWVPGGVLDLTISGSPSSFDQVGDILTFTYTLKNIGTVDLTGLSVSDTPGVSDCSGLPGTLAKGASYSCTVTYSTVQADLNAGEFVNIVSANSTEALSDTKSVTIDADQLPELALTKTPSDTFALSAGTIITYTYTLTNSGNVTLTSGYTVTDDKIPADDIDCSGAQASIDPGESTECEGPYTVTNDDLNNGIITNVATATATFEGGPVTSNQATANVTTSALELSVVPITPTATHADQTISYRYTLKNLGLSTLTGPSITDTRATFLSCESNTINPGSSIYCWGEYVITQPDMDLGETLLNTGTATTNSGTVISNPATSSVTISPAALLSLTVTPSTNLQTVVGQIVYRYEITNEGTVTLNAPFTVTDTGLFGTKTCTVSSGSIAPQDSVLCDLPYDVLAQPDLDAGSIINNAVISYTYNGNPIPNAYATATVITYDQPRISLSISSSPDSYNTSDIDLTITFTVKNTGNAAVGSPSISANGFLGAINCPGGTLDIGQSADCNVVYKTTTTDMTTGSIAIAGTASAAGAPNTSNTLTINSTIACYVYHNYPGAGITFAGSGANRKMYMKIISDALTSTTIHIKNIEIRNWNYQSNAQQYISAVYLEPVGGALTNKIWTGANTQRIDPLTLPYPSSASFTGNVSIAPGQTRELVFTFNKNYSETGNEYIWVTFAEAGCPVLKSEDPSQVKP